MRVYETTFIVNPQTDDATIDQQVVAVSDLISRYGGKVLREDRMGTRRLAYPINKLTQGYYHSFIFEAPQEVLPELERYFRINEQYLRNLTLVFEGDLEAEARRAEAGELREPPSDRDEREGREGRRGRRSDDDDDDDDDMVDRKYRGR